METRRPEVRPGQIWIDGEGDRWHSRADGRLTMNPDDEGSSGQTLEWIASQYGGVGLAAEPVPEEGERQHSACQSANPPEAFNLALEDILILGALGELLRGMLSPSHGLERP
jgi:hypothetical protein